MNEVPEMEGSASRRQRVIQLVRLAVDDLRSLGVEARIFGSLAAGSFGDRSDVDFLVVSCPSELKYTIEGRVEDRLGDLPFDVVYLDEIPPDRIERFTRHAVEASRLS